jgi:flagellar basal-body rod protein FlgG
MNPALSAAATGMMAQQLRTEVIANNLANVNTTGFKRSRAHFEDLLYQTVQGAAVIGQPDSQTQPSIQVGRGTRLVGVQRLHTQGAMETTNRPLDIAIEGEGFFQVQMPNGQTAYTRDGSFEISDQGALVTSQGYALVPGIKIPTDATAVTISQTGIVSVTKGQSLEPQELGRIELAHEGGTLLVPDAARAPLADGDRGVRQGFVEESNVNTVGSMVDMIAVQRAYASIQKAVTTIDAIRGTAVNDLGKPV